MRSPLANLSTVVPTAGLLAVVSVLFGSTAFDSFKDSPFWVRFSQTNELVAGLENGSTIADSLALLVFSAAPALVFAGAAAATMTGPDLRRRDLPAILAHSIVPIILGYIVAHYASYWFEVGQDTLIKAHPTLLANIKVGAVVVGHVVAAIASHDRSVALLPPRHQILGQLPLLMAMVAFTSGGLYLLFAA